MLNHMHARLNDRWLFASKREQGRDKIKRANKTEEQSGKRAVQLKTRPAARMVTVPPNFRVSSPECLLHFSHWLQANDLYLSQPSICLSAP